MTTQSERPQPIIDPIFEAICRGELTLHLMEGKFTAEAIAQWQADSSNQAKVQRVLAAYEMQAQLRAARARPKAIYTLMELATHPNSNPETIRKACADVLKASAPASSGALKRNSKSADPAHVEKDHQQDSTSTAANPSPGASRGQPNPAIELTATDKTARILHGPLDGHADALLDQAPLAAGPSRISGRALTLNGARVHV